MNIHEYQAKEILKKYSIPVPNYEVVRSIQEVDQALVNLNSDKAVVKIQVHAGGRGKAGGVKIGKNKEEIKRLVDQMLGMKIVNEQTGSRGIVAHEVMISELSSIQKEYYLGCVINRDKAAPILIASPEGGMEIEEIAKHTPHKILQLPIDFNHGLKGFHLIELAKFMGWSKEQAASGMKIAKALAQAFLDLDASLLEINPFVLTQEGTFTALDAKISVDDNALFRQKKIESFYDPTQSSESEKAAKEHDLAYIALDGNIGCMVNGAGLAMATMDIIHHFGGKPANFLDVGGSATKEKVAQGFKIILSDPHVQVILVNIFGGIMNCATIAEGIIHAVKEVGIKVPLVVRLEGTNVENGKKILKESHLPIISAEDLKDAAMKSVQALRG
ncbi:MAG: ADP-forming succinate--CoA ligase subunit beta [Chlamydiae bacterium]|nr:ADP-forming succinate--CoA ligase subunit beta [Chlamydiota bacterium]